MDRPHSGDEHIPVLLDEVLKHLVTSKTGTYIDATFGRGGHCRGLLGALAADARVVAFDRDAEAVQAGNELKDPRFTIFHARFSELSSRLSELQIEAVDGVLMDIGVSSPQLDSADRGFSFSHDGPLDMRMDATTGITARDWLAQVTADEISTVLKRHGEEKFARRIAQAIVKRAPIETTAELAEVVAGAVPAAVRHRSGKHPATQTFQAIRIHINQEDAELTSGLEQAFAALKPGGRLAVISFHSLEDRVVKQRFKSWSQPPPMPRRIPVRHADQATQGRLVAGPLKASPRELAGNPRSRSAVLRVVEKSA
ncbi:MAG: 16S rRNA (cytosine(1402)-N(4))-methyltransferase RsmH [Pseudomonadales bacterium]